MNRQTRHRLLAATALAALLAGGAATAATPQHRDDDHARQARKEQRQDKRQDKRDDHREAVQARRDDRREAVQVRRDVRRDTLQEHRVELQQRAVVQARRDDRRDAVQERRQDRREAVQDRRDDRRDWRQDQRQDRRDDRQDARRDAQRRMAYARYRQDYDRRMHSRVQLRIVPRFYVRPAHYRYGYGGHWYTTSNYGAEMLRMAVQNGYREGMRAGQADRYDGWPGGFRDSFAWRDASFGYGAGYVGRADYAYYFRQGFERGYEDGYYGRMRYGRYANNEAIIIDAVLGTILNLQMLR